MTGIEAKLDEIGPFATHGAVDRVEWFAPRD